MFESFLRFYGSQSLVVQAVLLAVGWVFSFAFSVGWVSFLRTELLKPSLVWLKKLRLLGDYTLGLLLLYIIFVTFVVLSIGFYYLVPLSLGWFLVSAFVVQTVCVDFIWFSLAYGYLYRVGSTRWLWFEKWMGSGLKGLENLVFSIRLVN